MKFIGMWYLGLIVLGDNVEMKYGFEERKVRKYSFVGKFEVVGESWRGKDYCKLRVVFLLDVVVVFIIWLIKSDKEGKSMIEWIIGCNKLNER